MPSSRWPLLPLTAALAFALATPAPCEAAAPAKKPVAAKPQPKKPVAKKVSPKRGKPKVEDEEDYQWAIGLTGGGNFANIGGEPIGGVEGAETNMNAGFNVGVLVLYNLASFADFEFGLGYATKGYSTELENDITADASDASVGKMTTTVDETFSYIEIPVGIRLNYPAGRIRPFLSVGLYLGILASSEHSKTVDLAYNKEGTCPGDLDQELKESCSNNTTAEIPGANTFDVGVRGQLGVEFDVTDEFLLFVGGGYSRGFLDPVDESEKARKVTVTDSSGTPAGDSAGEMSAEGTEKPATIPALTNASQAHSVIQATAGFLYAF